MRPELGWKQGHIENELALVHGCALRFDLRRDRQILWLRLTPQSENHIRAAEDPFLRFSRELTPLLSVSELAFT